MVEGRGRVARGSRVYTRIVLGAAAGVALLQVVLWGLGFGGSDGWPAYGRGLVLAIAGALVWEVVERHARPGGGVRWSAWLALPAAVGLALGAAVFFAMAIHPPLLDSFTRQGRVEARLVDDGGRLALDLFFPRAMERSGMNLALDDVPVPAAYGAAPDGGAAGGLRWLSPRTARLDLERLLRDLKMQRPRAIAINTLPLAAPFRFENGERVPPQQATLEEEAP
jgi:hypothetical protein